MLFFFEMRVNRLLINFDPIKIRKDFYRELEYYVSFDRLSRNSNLSYCRLNSIFFDRGLNHSDHIRLQRKCIDLDINFSNFVSDDIFY